MTRKKILTFNTLKYKYRTPKINILRKKVSWKYSNQFYNRHFIYNKMTAFFSLFASFTKISQFIPSKIGWFFTGEFFFYKSSYKNLNYRAKLLDIFFTETLNSPFFLKWNLNSNSSHYELAVKAKDNSMLFILFNKIWKYVNFLSNTNVEFLKKLFFLEVYKHFYFLIVF